MYLGPRYCGYALNCHLVYLAIPYAITKSEIYLFKDYDRSWIVALNTPVQAVTVQGWIAPYM